jgi:NADH-quinone oxidoreductase subunit C
MPDAGALHPERAALAPLLERLTQAAGTAFLEAVAAPDMDELAIRPEGLLPVMDLARSHGFNHLLDVGGVDHHPLTPRFEVAYHLTALPIESTERSAGPIAHPPRLRVRVFCDEPEPAVPSVTELWPSANWPEREVFDQFGIRFDGHPELRRILNPEDFVGHPLRKDFPLRGQARRFVPGGRVGPVPPLETQR